MERLKHLDYITIQDHITLHTFSKELCLLPGWTIIPEPSLALDMDSFEKAETRWNTPTGPEDTALSPMNLTHPLTWEKKDKVYSPSTLLKQVVLTLILDDTLRGCRMREVTLLTVPDRELDDNLQQLHQTNTLSITDL